MSTAQTASRAGRYAMLLLGGLIMAAPLFYLVSGTPPERMVDVIRPYLD